MADNDELLVTARLRDELSASVAQARGQIRELGREVDKVNATSRAAAGGTDTHRRSLDGLAGAARKTDSALSSLSGRVQGAFATGLKVAAVGVAALTVALGTFGLKSANSFQQTQIALDGMLGSAQAGQDLFKQLQSFNLKTPFELGDLTNASRTLLSFGFTGTQVLPILKSVADVASGLGGGQETLQRIILNLGQIQSQGKVTGRELRDLAQVGFPGYQLIADALGMTREQVQALGDDATVSADKFIAAVTSQSGPLARFSGMADKQAHSLAGLWSNIKDTATQGLVAATQPLVAALEPILGKGGPLESFITGFLTSVGPPLASLGGNLLKGLMAALPVATPILNALVGGINQLLAAAAPGFAALQPVVGQITDSLGRLIAALVPVMPQLVDAFVALVGVAPTFIDLLTRMVPLVDPVARLLTSLLALGPVKDLLAGALIVLLGYRQLSGVAHAVGTFAGALRGLAGAEREESAARAAGTPAAGGIGAGTLAGGLAVVGGGLAIADAAKRKAGPGSDLELIGGATALGAGIGTLVPIPGVGTGVGALAGLLAGGTIVAGRHLLPGTFGDTPAPRAMARTAARALALDSAVPGRRYITNLAVGATSDSDHVRGRAVDLVGSGLFAYAQALRASGGYADYHGSHLHAVFGDTPSPRTLTSGPAAGGTPLVQINSGGALVRDVTVTADVDLEQAIYAGIARYDRDRQERGAH